MKRALLFLLVLFTACGPAAPKQKNTLRVSFFTSPATVDPRKSGDFVSSTLICLLYDGLTRCKGGTEIELALAESVEISKDQKTYLFRLKETYWTDGRPVTAYDFEKSWKSILTPGFPSLCTYLLYPVKNGEKCAKGDLPIEQAGIHALDDMTLQVTLERPTPYFLSLTAFPLFLPFPSHVDKDPLLGPDLVSNGPYRIEKAAANAEIVLVKNQDYWNRDALEADAIRIGIVPDEMTALQMFERGELDCLGGPLCPLPPDAVQSLNKIQFIPMAASTFCTFNTEKGPFQNRSLRRAFSLAIDREQIVRDIALPGQIPAKRLIPPSLIGEGAAPIIPERDAKEARRWFKVAIEEMKIDPAALNGLVLYYKTGQSEKRLAQALQRQWLEILGVEVKLEQSDPRAHLQRLHEKNYELSLASWISQFDDPVGILDRFKDKGHPKNFPGWENPEFIKKLKVASETHHLENRLAILQSAEEILAAEMVLAPLYHWSSPTLTGPRLNKLPTTCSGGVLFERCSLNRD